MDDLLCLVRVWCGGAKARDGLYATSVDLFCATQAG